MKNEKGITLLSLVVTVVVLSLLASVLVSASIKDNPAMESSNLLKEFYYNEQTKTQERINGMTNGWEDIIL